MNRFNINRFIDVLKKEWSEYFRAYGISLIVWSCIPVLLWIATLIFGNVVEAGTRAAFIFCFILLAMMNVPEKVYGKVNLQREGVAYSMLPATSGEKFFSMMIYCSIVTPVLCFAGCIIMASQDVLMAEQMAKNAKKKMKTTAVSVVLDGKKAYIGHIGDSRAYIFSQNKVRKRTLDHSIPQMLVLAGDLKESEIRHHQDRNIVLKVMGMDWEEPLFELMPPIPLKKCQAFLLCSDGFWEWIEEKEMCELLKQANSVNEWMDSMVEVVKSNGQGENMDNFSAIAVWVN